jgi:redox-sensitive bicupin YhaK (pirin superfamily)
MEIVTVVLEGALEHRDSLGTGSVVRPGDVQRMSAGTGLRHSEFNASKTEPVHFLQIWIVPERSGIVPGYEQKTFGREEKRGRLRLVGSRDGREGSVTIHQDADMYATLLEEGDSVEHGLGARRIAWIHVARGEIEINGRRLSTGDGLAADQAGALRLLGRRGAAEALLFDMAAPTQAQKH